MKAKVTIRTLLAVIFVVLVFIGTSETGYFDTAAADPISVDGSIAFSSTDPVTFSPPTITDVDNNGREDILVGTSDGKVFAVEHTSGGSRLTQMWSYNTANALPAPTTIRGAISVADLDRDGTNEVVVPVGDVFSTETHGGLIVLNGDTGSLLWKYSTYDHSGQQLRPDGRSDGIVGAPALGDLDNDGTLEIVFGSFDHRLYAFNHDGTLVQGWPKFIRDTVWTSPALADLTNDGFLEIIFGVDTHKEGGVFNTPDGGGIYVLDKNARVLPGWPKFIGQTIYSSPAVGDLDRDGDLEIVHGTGDYFNNTDAGYKVYTWDAHGNLLWTGQTDNYVPADVALGDINGDGTLEVVVGVKDKYVYAWNHNGGQVWRRMPTNLQGNTMPVGRPALADYNGDSKSDIFINIYWDSAILNGPNGAQLTADSFPNDPKPAYTTKYTTANNAPALGDIDNDGKLELVLASGDQNGENAKIYFWDLETPAQTDPYAPWPMVGQNGRHTNTYPESPAFYAEVVHHTVPEIMQPGESRTVSITVENMGTSTWRSSDLVRLGAVGDADPFTTNSRVEMDNTTVAPGQTATFEFTLTAPNTPGYHTTDWRMVNDSIGQWFGRTVRVPVKVGNEPALQVLTTEGIFAAGLAEAAFPPPEKFTNWPSVKAWALTHDKRGYHMIDKYGGYWYGGDTFPLVSNDLGAGVQDIVLGPDGISYYVLTQTGEVHKCDTNTCARVFSQGIPTGIVARSMALTANGQGAYVVDGFGNVYRGGNAPALQAPNGLPLSNDVVRRIQLTADGSGYYLMDMYGRIWNGGSAPHFDPQYTPQIGTDWARDFELTDSEKGYYLLDKHGNVHSGGTATKLSVNSLNSFSGDVARDLIVLDSRRSEMALNVAPDETILLHERNGGTPATTTIKIENTGLEPFSWSAQPSQSGMDVSPNNGNIAPGESQRVDVTIDDTSQLHLGSHTYELVVEASSGSKSRSTTTIIEVHIVDNVYSAFLPVTIR